MRLANPCVFVVGCPRSGTTLLQRMLDSHPQLVVANDTHFIPAAIPGVTPHEDLALTDEMVDRIRSFRTAGGMGFHRLGLADRELEDAAAGARTYSELVADLYSRFAALHEKPLAGEKTPDYVRCLPLLHALFPIAKVVHLIRDGRDVTMALVDWAHDSERTGRLRGPARTRVWKESPVAASALWWRWQVEAGRSDAVQLGPSYREVRYEALVGSPEQTLRELTDFLELPFDAKMLTHHLDRRARPDDPLAGASAWLPVTPRIRDWTADMPAHDVELVEELAGDLLAVLGYERAFPKISRPLRTEAKAHRKRWARKLARRTAAHAG